MPRKMCKGKKEVVVVQAVKACPMKKKRKRKAKSAAKVAKSKTACGDAKPVAVRKHCRHKRS
jgi:hypothetical protein